MNINERVLLMNLANLSEEDKDYLHKLKNLAQALTGRLQLKHGMIDHDIQSDINKETL